MPLEAGHLRKDFLYFYVHCTDIIFQMGPLCVHLSLFEIRALYHSSICGFPLFLYMCLVYSPLSQHWLPGDGPCKHAMWAFFTSFLLPSSPDLFQWLTAGLPLLAIKLSQVHRCNGCSVCESIFHISCFWGLRKKRYFAAIGKEFCWSGRESALYRKTQCESCWELRSKRKRKLLVRKAEIKIRANKTF